MKTGAIYKHKHSLRQSTVSSAILLNIDRNWWYPEFRQEMVFWVYVCPYTYVAYLAYLYTYAYAYPSENHAAFKCLISDTFCSRLPLLSPKCHILIVSLQFA